MNQMCLTKCMCTYESIIKRRWMMIAVKKEKGSLKDMYLLSAVSSQLISLCSRPCANVSAGLAGWLVTIETILWKLTNKIGFLILFPMFIQGVVYV